MDVSVVIPTYNSSEFIYKAIDSVIVAAEGLQFEVILVDDFSNDIDKLKEVVQGYASARLILKESKSNAAVSRNTGIMNATGKHIFLLDSDDAFAPDHIRNRISLHADTGADFIFGAFTERGSRDRHFIDRHKDCSARDYLFVHDGDIRTSTISLASNALLMNGSLDKHQDWGFFLDVDDAQVKWVYDDRPTVILYVDRTTNMSSSANTKASQFFIDAYLLQNAHITGFCKRQFLSAIVSNDEQSYRFFTQRMTLSCLSTQLKAIKILGDASLKLGLFSSFSGLLRQLRSNR
ncbi:glycosyltransferase family 2 protein [Larsenimonas rhizosphaerae]|uniref:glycosyltransferase family 2 protein n=1 Tax=Larsenimonas rhizosphaerae TaxID=2944682 RepID=UPI002033B7BF|nr:glycosyltransferase family 2 protein [Larsenimonas rhizosphaerae]MCM2130465.1 glycosyltransferase [Larsenimonas rhizosphaerae]